MKKLIIGVILTVLFALPVFSQSSAVQVTSGRISIDGTSLAGSGEIQTPAFSADFIFNSNLFSHFETDCYINGCLPGATFNVPLTWSFGNTFHGSGFTMGGTTYNNAAQNADGITVDRVSFTIPKVSRRKGILTFRKPFRLAGSFRVCKVDDRVQPCPEGGLIYSGIIEGRGTLTINGRIKVNSLGRARFYIESFEYIFEP